MGTIYRNGEMYGSNTSIDDTKTSDKTTWSSEKIDTKITEKIQQEFIHKWITGQVVIEANAAVEKSMIELGYTSMTGYTLINCTISMNGIGATKVIPHFSGKRMSYVTFTNNNNYKVTVEYNIDCLHQRV